VNRYDFSVVRSMLMNGFVHTAEGFAKSGAGDGQFTDFSWPARLGLLRSEPAQLLLHGLAGARSLRGRRIRKPIEHRNHLSGAGPERRLVENLLFNYRGGCTDKDGDYGPGGKSNHYPVTTFSDFTRSSQYLYANPPHARALRLLSARNKRSAIPRTCFASISIASRRSISTSAMLPTTRCPAMHSSRA